MSPTSQVALKNIFAPRIEHGTEMMMRSTGYQAGPTPRITTAPVSARRARALWGLRLQFNKMPDVVQFNARIKSATCRYGNQIKLGLSVLPESVE